MRTRSPLTSPNGTVNFATRLPKALHRAVRRDAFETEVTMQAWVQDALETHLRRVGARRGPAGDEKPRLVVASGG